MRLVLLAMLPALLGCDPAADLQAPKNPEVTKNAQQELLAKALQPRLSKINEIIFQITGRTNGEIHVTPLGEFEKVVFPDGAKLVFESGVPGEFIDVQGEKIRWEYDSRGNLQRKIYPDGSVEEATGGRKLSISIRDYLENR